MSLFEQILTINLILSFLFKFFYPAFENTSFMCKYEDFIAGCVGLNFIVASIYGIYLVTTL